MNRKTHFLSILMLLSAASAYAQNNRNAIKERIDKLLRYEVAIDFDKTPNLTIGVIVKDSTYTFHYGKTEKGKPTKTANNQTIFEIGSVTKVFTATILAQAVSEGKLKLTDTVERFLPKGYTLPTFNGQPILFRDLATHTAGLPKYPYNIGNKEDEFNNVYKNYTDADEQQFLSSYRLRNAPFQTYNYSHLGYDILAQALINLYQAPSYEALIQQKITAPLRLNDTRVSLDSMQRQRLTQGHNMIGEPVQSWQFNSFEGSLGLKSTVVDMLTWLRAQFDTPNNTQTPFLLARTPLHKTDKTGVQSGLGWHCIKLMKRFPNVIVHSGTTDGFRCYTAFVPETRTAVVVLANSERPLDGIGSLILQIINYNWKLN